ncbi:MAG: hypothetical protein Ta2B_29570 [Termitinemataceae bacterium]|nr:MAG: hypothetical protein Ta2B_29570 [Termitinemataceae bacterium]
MKKLYACILIASFLITSCFGVKTQIDLKKDGSGTAAFQYSVGKAFLETLAAQDSTNGTPALPLTREDFENATKNIPGIKIKNFNTRDNDRDHIVNVDFIFNDIKSIVTFLDSQSAKANYQNDGGKNTLSLYFTDDSQQLGQEEKQFIPYVFGGYNMEFSINLPSPTKVVYRNNAGQEIKKIPVGNVTVEKNTVKFVSPMTDIIVANDPVIVEITW